MNNGLLVRLKPTGPWRFGSDSGARNESGEIYHSDSLFSAITHAMASLGELEPWLDSTARAASEPAVRFSSFFPWQGQNLFVTPPRHIWPPAAAANLILRAAHFLPVSTVSALLQGQTLDEQAWSVAPHSRCLVPSDEKSGSRDPYRFTTRVRAGVDRTSGRSHEALRAAGVEFAGNAGLWAVAGFASEKSRSRWAGPVQAAFRLLADSGFGGRRSAGWGRAESPEFQSGDIETLLLPRSSPPPPEPVPESSDTGPGAADAAIVPPPAAEAPATGYWLLSLFRPSERDTIVWDAGSYSLMTRGGRIESSSRWGEEKRLVRMVSEGSVLLAGSPPLGSAADVAPAGFPHPVYRYGFALSLPVRVGGSS